MHLHAYTEVRVVRIPGTPFQSHTLALIMGVYNSATKATEIRAFRMMQAPLQETVDDLKVAVTQAFEKPVLDYDDLKKQYAEMELREQGAGIAHRDEFTTGDHGRVLD